MNFPIYLIRKDSKKGSYALVNETGGFEGQTYIRYLIVDDGKLTEVLDATRDPYHGRSFRVTKFDKSDVKLVFIEDGQFMEIPPDEQIYDLRLGYVVESGKTRSY